MKKDIFVTLGGEQKKLILDNNALCELEKASGFSLGEMASGTEKMASLSFVRAAIYCGLLYAKSSRFTLNKVGSMMDLTLLEEYGTAIGNGIGYAFGLDDDDIDKKIQEASEDRPPVDSSKDGHGESLR